MAQFYGGYMNIPGSPGNRMAVNGMIAGNPFGADVGMPGIQGAPGNVAGMLNAGFYAGPQFAQLPQSFGFAGKSVYS